MEFSVATWVALGSLLTKLVDTVKQIRAGNWNAVVTQVVVWAGAIGLVALAAASDLAGGFAIPGTSLTLANLKPSTVVLVGLALGSTVSVAVDVRKAIDTSDSAKTPQLLPAPPDNPEA